jgi:hypothetical protein
VWYNRPIVDSVPLSPPQKKSLMRSKLYCCKEDCYTSKRNWYVSWLYGEVYTFAMPKEWAVCWQAERLPCLQGLLLLVLPLLVFPLLLLLVTDFRHFWKKLITSSCPYI